MTQKRRDLVFLWSVIRDFKDVHVNWAVRWNSWRDFVKEIPCDEDEISFFEELEFLEEKSHERRFPARR